MESAIAGRIRDVSAALAGPGLATEAESVVGPHIQGVGRRNVSFGLGSAGSQATAGQLAEGSTTGYSNDHGYANGHARQVQGPARRGDLVVASTFPAVVDEAHLIPAHLICGALEESFFAEGLRRIRGPDGV